MYYIVRTVVSIALLMLGTATIAAAQPTGASAWLHYAPSTDGIPEHATITGEQLRTNPLSVIGPGEYRVFLNRGSRQDSDYTVMISSNDRNAAARAWIETKDQVRVDLQDVPTGQNRDAAFTVAVYEHGYPNARKGALAGAYCRPIPDTNIIDVAGWQLAEISPQVEKVGVMGQYIVHLNRTVPTKDFGVLVGASGANRVTTSIESSNRISVFVFNEIGLPADGDFSLLVFDAVNPTGKLAFAWGTYRWPLNGNQSDAQFRGSGIDTVIHSNVGQYKVLVDRHIPPLDCVVMPSSLDSNRFVTARVDLAAGNQVIVVVRDLQSGEPVDGSFSIAIINTKDPSSGVNDGVFMPAKLDLTFGERPHGR